MHVVTGAFGYIGKYIARRLLRRGEEVRTITTHPERPNPLLGVGPFAGQVVARPYRFDEPDKLTDWLRGAKTLFNTYWIRFEHGGTTFEQAGRNTRTLFECARKAGVGRIVHISVTHATDSQLPYYRSKAGAGTGAGGVRRAVQHCATDAGVRLGRYFGEQHCLVGAQVADLSDV